MYSHRLNKNKRSLDIGDFDVSFARGLSLEDGATTLTDFTAEIITSYLLDILKSESSKYLKILVCGGGRKNLNLISKLKNKFGKKIKICEDFGINGDLTESNAFAYLAIRFLKHLPISYPSTTGVKKPTIGGKLVL